MRIGLNNAEKLNASSQYTSVVERERVRINRNWIGSTI